MLKGRELRIFSLSTKLLIKIINTFFPFLLHRNTIQSSFEVRVRCYERRNNYDV
jgi:hypothetical protein